MTGPGPDYPESVPPTRDGAGVAFLPCMSRKRRADYTDTVVHVLNRSVRRAILFPDPEDYAAFERVLIETWMRLPMRVLAWCVMPNHWHLLLWPSHRLELPVFMHRLTMTHAVRWHHHRATRGTGPVYQGRYRVSPVEPDNVSLFRVCRYVERNALRAGLVESAREWRWGSLWHRLDGNRAGLLTPGPVALPPQWQEMVDEAHTKGEIADLQRCMRRGAPIGSPKWTQEATVRFGLQDTLRKPGGQPGKRYRGIRSPGRSTEAARDTATAQGAPEDVVGGG